MKRITLKEIKNLDLNSLNNVFQDIYRELNRISKSADEVTFTNTKDNGKKIVLNDNGKKYVEVTGTARYDKDTVSAQKRGIKQTKKDLAIDNVTNESKATMFTNPSFSGSSKINTVNSNIIKFQYDDSDNNTLVDVVTLLKSPIIRFMAGAVPHWKMGFDTDDTVNKFKIDNGTGTTLADPSEFELDNSGNLVLSGTLTSSNGTCGGIDTIAWNSWEFNVFRAAGSASIAGARRYYRDTDDADDYRRWDAYFDNTTGSYVIATANIAGLFVVPEDCKVGAMYGQIAGDGSGSTTNPVIELWKFTPSNGSSATLLNVASVTANVGVSGDESYAFNQTSSFTNNTLSAGDVIIPTLAHSNASAVQSYYGNLTVKFVKQ